VLVIIVIAGLLFALYQYRIQQLKKQQQIRRGIASDLHDDLGSTLNTVKIFAHMAKIGEETENFLEKIEESLSLASAGLRDMIWVLDDSGDTVHELVERIKKNGQSVCQANNIRLETSVGGDLDSKSISKTEGFDLEKSPKGCGLRNITERASQIRYHTSIQSSPGYGTSITLAK
jgi:signal transduction histidine kinase